MGTSSCATSRRREGGAQGLRYVDLHPGEAIGIGSVLLNQKVHPHGRPAGASLGWVYATC